MSTNPTHGALLSLLPPTVLSSLPPKLLSTAESLLSLSRQRAANLKSDEEIARAHACAEIACRKLRIQLRLPNIKSGSGAPCRPNVYKKLVTYLEGVLRDFQVSTTPGRREEKHAGGVRTPGTGASTGKRRRVVDLDERDLEVDGDVETPSKRRKVTNSGGKSLPATPTKLSAKKTNGFLGKIEAPSSKNKKSAEAPEFVLPAIRKLCRTFKTPRMVPHVYTGVCVLLDLAGLWPVHEDDKREPDEVVQGQMNLLVATYLLTLTQMQKGEMTETVYNGVSNQSAQILEMEPEMEEEGARANVQEWIAKINEEEWTIEHGKGRDWWFSIPENVIAPLKMPSLIAQKNDDPSSTANAAEDPTHTALVKRQKKAARANAHVSRREELRRQLEKEDPDDVLLPGLGTMMNDAVDYFSDERRAEYAEWEAGIMKQIEAIEKGGGGGRKRKAVAAT